MWNGICQWELRLYFRPLHNSWACSLNNPFICHWLYYFCIRHSFPSLSPALCRLPSVPQPHSALSAPRGGPSALLPSYLPREWQCSCNQLPGVSEPDLCGGKDPPACGEVRGLQWSYGRSPEESVQPDVTHSVCLSTICRKTLAHTLYRCLFLKCFLVLKTMKTQQSISSISIPLTPDNPQSSQWGH